MRRVLFCAFLVACGVGVFSAGQAAFLRDLPLTLVQPDGTPVSCFLTGDEYFRWAHDAEGYVILQDPSDGRYVYADTRGGDWRPSSWTVGEVDPAGVGLQPRPPVPAALHRERYDYMQGMREKHGRVPAPSTGTIINVVIFMRFSDQTEYPEPTSQYDAMLNAQGSGANSMSRYYQEVSQGLLDARGSMYPTSTGTVTSYQSTHPRGYYVKYNQISNPGGYQTDDEGFGRLHALFQAAVQSVASQVSPSLNLDYNSDGYVDNVCFVARGGSEGWAEVLWPHQWEMMPNYPSSLNGKQVKTYNFQLEDVLNNPQIGTGVLCHEFFHALGAPDLYRYQTGSGSFFPVWSWDVMENSTNPPQHMLMFMKRRYGGWVSEPTVITQSGTYTLNPVTSPTNNCYRINSPVATQHFLVEYRQQASSMFEANLPGSGLIVYRINTAADGNGNAQGPPDEVLVYRPGGDNSTNGTPDLAYFSATVGRTSINDQTNPAPILANGAPGNLNISNVGAAGSTLSFTVTINGEPPPGGCQTQPGDANADNQVNVFDVVAVVNDILQTAPLGTAGRACADMNSDQAINIFDVVQLVNRILNPPPGGPGALARSPGEATAPVAVRIESGPRGARLWFDAGRVHGIEVSAPWPRSGESARCELFSGSADVVVSSAVVNGTLRVIAYRPVGGPLGEGDVRLELPSSGETAGASLDPAGLRVLLSGGQGEPLPVELRAGIGSDPPSGGVGLRVLPNPARGDVRIVLERTGGRALHVTLTDASGRTVRSWTTGGGLREEIAWDGRDARGARVRAGVYFVSCAGSPGRRLLLLH